MRKLLPVLICLIATATMPPAFAQGAKSAQGVGAIEVNSKQIAISGNGHQRSYPCNGRPAIVEGTDHVITFTGTCASLALSGVNNTVSVELASGGRLSVNGTDNQVRWRSRGEPRQDLSGVDNKVVRETMPK